MQRCTTTVRDEQIAIAIERGAEVRVGRRKQNHITHADMLHSPTGTA